MTEARMDNSAAANFILAGNALFTLQSEKQVRGIPTTFRKLTTRVEANLPGLLST